MKVLYVALLWAALCTGCRHPAEQGAVPRGPFEGEMARAEGSTPYLPGQTGPLQRSGLANMTIAASREEAALDTSGSGAAEISRRAGAAVIQGPIERSGWVDASGAVMGDSPAELLLNRIRVALSTPSAEQAEVIPPVSIQTLNSLRTRFDGEVLTVFGTVQSAEEKRAIETVARNLPDLPPVNTQLELIDQKETRPAD